MSPSARLGFLAFAAVPASAFLSASACDDGRTHIFGAYRYEPTRDCLEGSAAVDVIDGPDPGACASVRCWTSPAGEIYVTSTACDAPPDYREHTQDPAQTPCERALAAFRCHVTCPPNGAGVDGADGVC